MTPVQAHRLVGNDPRVTDVRRPSPVTVARAVELARVTSDPLWAAQLLRDAEREAGKCA